MRGETQKERTNKKSGYTLKREGEGNNNCRTIRMKKIKNLSYNKIIMHITLTKNERRKI